MSSPRAGYLPDQRSALPRPFGRLALMQMQMQAGGSSRDLVPDSDADTGTDTDIQLDGGRVAVRATLEPGGWHKSEAETGSQAFMLHAFMPSGLRLHADSGLPSTMALPLPHAL